MKIILLILGTLLITGGMFFYTREQSRTIKNYIRTIIMITVISLILYQITTVPILNVVNFGVIASLPIWPYLLNVIVITIIYIITTKKMLKIVTVEEVDIKNKLILVLSTIATFLGMFLIGFTLFFMGNFGEITLEQIIYNFTSPVTGMGGNMVIMILLIPVFITIVPTVVYILIITYNKNIKKRNKKIYSFKLVTKITKIISIIILVTGISFAGFKLPFDEVYNSFMSEESTFIEDNYISANDVIIKPIGKPRNLIHIYAESMESTFTTKEYGGNEIVDLIPELRDLADEGITFSNTDHKLGGPHQTYGSSWSVAGMVNMDSGIPLKIAGNGNSYGKENEFLPGMVNLGDIAEYYGYEQSIMFGSEASFGGLDVYYKSHGNYNILDYKHALETGQLPSGYLENWGYEDAKLYEFAKEEITRLSETGKPFNFKMETADTHFPDGYVYPETENVYPKGTPQKQYGNVIRLSSKHIGEFVEWSKQQPFYENTTIVITGDHKSMDTKYFKGMDKGYERNVFNTFLNTGMEIEDSKTKNREYSPSDYFPTILAAMGFEIDGDRLGLGTNLFSDKPTLIEEIGFDEYEKELTAFSEFYNSVIMNTDANIYIEKKQ